jgi:hypothetical protein
MGKRWSEAGLFSGQNKSVKWKTGAAAAIDAQVQARKEKAEAERAKKAEAEKAEKAARVAEEKAAKKAERAAKAAAGKRGK